MYRRNPFRNLPYGVPEWSSIVPLLFSVYARKLFEVIKYYLPDAHAYTDDSQLYLAFKEDSSSCKTEALKGMEKWIGFVRAWMISDKLKLNEDKTKVMVIGTRQQLNKEKSRYNNNFIYKIDWQSDDWKTQYLQSDKCIYPIYLHEQY